MFNIAKRVFLINIRSSRYTWFCMLFPIFLMTMIGAVMTNTFKTETTIKKLTVYYVDNGSNKSRDVFNAVKENKGNLDMEFKHIDSVEEGKDKVRINESGFIHLDGDKIKIYTNDKNPVHTGMLNGIFNGVNNRMNAVLEMFKVNPKVAQEILIKENEIKDIKTEAVPKINTPSSYDYYGVAELNLIILYLAMFPLADMASEKRNNLKARIKLSGLSNFKYYIGTLIGYTGLAMVITLPGYLYSILALKVNWGNNYLIPYLYILLFAIMTISFGLALGVMLNDDQKATIVLNSIVFPVICFLGGSYINLPDEIGSAFQYVTNLSPLRWMNRGIFRMAFSNDYSVINTSIIVNLSIIVASIIIVMIFSKREEAM